MSPLSDRVIAITGASSGIGRATAERLAGEGATVALFARRADRLDELAEAIRSKGGNALAAPGDVTREGDVRAFVAQTMARFGRLDAMICSAGIGYHGAIDDTADDTMRRLVETNVMGTFYAVRAALEIFRRQGSGHIVAVSSIVGRRGVPGAGAYAATKAAQAGLIESLRAEFLGTPLRASIIYPVSVDSEFRAAQERDFGRRVEGVGPRQSPERVAGAIVNCIISPTPDVYPYKLSRALAVLNVVAPATADRLAKRFGRRVTGPETGDDGGAS
jgi:NADP-dependent 3-hydroxy acid dehydrogenase YdfG